MARLDGDLFQHNFVRVVVLDVSDDYKVMREPLPTCCYPVLSELWLPRFQLPTILPNQNLVSGYLYDWHEADNEANAWYVGVVDEALAEALLHAEQSA